MATTYTITLFKSKFEPVSGVSELTWDEVIDLFSQPHNPVIDKLSQPGFSATLFKTPDQVISDGEFGNIEEVLTEDQSVRRKQRNAVQVDMFIADYDGTMTLDEAKDRFKDYEYIGYTSYGHLKDGKTHKFRLIFPLIKPIPAFRRVDQQGRDVDRGIYYDLSEAILAFAPGVDPACKNGVQLFFPPSAPPERVSLAESWHNNGVLLDWTQWKTNEQYDTETGNPLSPRTATGRINRRLEPDQEFRYSRGVIAAKDVQKRIQKVVCPFHADNKGSEFITRHDSGVVSFTCKKCGTFALPPEKIHAGDDDDLPLIEFDKVWMEGNDRAAMLKILQGIKQDILKDTGLASPRQRDKGKKLNYQFKSHILYLPEGSGKSQLALEFLKDPPGKYFLHSPECYRHQIIFACRSWAQVMEQYSSFLPKLKAIGRTARIAWSFDGLIQRRFKVKVRRGQSGAFQPGDVKVEETITEIIETHPNLDEKFIRLSWNFLLEVDGFRSMATPDVLSIERVDGETETDNAVPPAIIFTTYTQLRLFEVKGDSIPKNWIIWFDDPDIHELIDIKPAPPPTPRTKKEKLEIDGTRYDSRPEELSLGLPLKDHRCIYTTTEHLTVRKLKHLLDSRDEKYQVHGDRFPVLGGRVSILGTKAVQKRYDAVIPLIVRRIQVETKQDVLLIANGIPADFNHATNKGRNDLKDRHILVELSHPHPQEVKTICDDMGLPFATYQDEVSKTLMLDKMHQAIGRNSGFRAVEGERYECVVLVDKNRHDYLLKECTYWIDEKNSVIIDRTAKMGRLEKRITDTASPLVKAVENLINNPFPYLTDGRKVKPDIKSVISTLPPEKVEDYLVRLLVAITSYSGVRIDQDSPKDSQSRKLWELGKWIVQDLIQPDRRPSVLQRYQSELKSS